MTVVYIKNLLETTPTERNALRIYNFWRIYGQLIGKPACSCYRQLKSGKNLRKFHLLD